jgi:hypothetical protein
LQHLAIAAIGAIVNLNHPAHIIEWHFIKLTVSNVIVIGLMFIAFFAALLLPFPGAGARRAARRGADE